MRVRSRHETALADRPDGHELVVEAVADELDRTGEILIEVLAAAGQTRQSIEDAEVAGMALAVERIREDPVQRGRLAPARSLVAAATLAGSVDAAIGGPDLGGGEEALEVAEAVPAIPPRVDPVVAQPTGVAPRTDRVRVHAKQACRLRHGEGRVGGSGR